MRRRGDGDFDMAISIEQFRDTLRCFAAGVTLVTARSGERVHGMTVSAFTSVSASPPLIAVVIDRATTLPTLLAEPAACFAVNILAEDQSGLSDRFAFLKDEDRFGVGCWESAPSGAPVLVDALAWLDCRLVATHPAGSHNLYLGEVETSWVRPEGVPLVYWNRGYRRLAT